MALTGTGTLDAQGDPAAVFIFQAGSTLISASNSTVALMGEAQACDVFWQVGSWNDSPATAEGPTGSLGGPGVGQGSLVAGPQQSQPVVERAEPVALSVPRIGLRKPLIQLGLQEDGTVEAPADPASGWFHLGPPPGAPESSVILGRVDCVDGPAVFHRLNEMRVGDEITVNLEDGSSVAFEVRSVRDLRERRLPRPSRLRQDRLTRAEPRHLRRRLRRLPRRLPGEPGGHRARK